jgi:hypothetical protein
MSRLDDKARVHLAMLPRHRFGFLFRAVGDLDRPIPVLGDIPGLLFFGDFYRAIVEQMPDVICRIVQRLIYAGRDLSRRVDAFMQDEQDVDPNFVGQGVMHDLLDALAPSFGWARLRRQGKTPLSARII